MKRQILFLFTGLLLTTSQAFGETKCFIASENHRNLIEEGSCKSRHSPCSTFKIPLALMGYDSGILIDETHPEWEFKKGYLDYFDLWKQTHNPMLWMKHSCVWFSQVLTTKLGMKKFKDYLTKFKYGNMDVSGDIGKNNGLTRSWLSSSIQISPEEQIEFLYKLLNNKFPVSKKAHEMTRNILFIEDLSNVWKMYGKTGCGDLLYDDGSHDTTHHLGWFIGWATKNNRTIILVHYVEDEEVEYLASKKPKKKQKKDY